MRQIFPATLSLSPAHSPEPIGREVAGLRITDQEDQRGREGEADLGQSMSASE